MSKLIDKLDKLTQGDIKPFGFTVSVSQSTTPQMLTIARTKLDAEAKTMPEITTDAVLLSVDDTARAIDSINKIGEGKLPSIWGIEAASIGKKEADKLAKIGCDFIVLKLASPAPALISNESLAKVIQVSSSIDDSMIRALNSLPVDVVIVQDNPDLQDLTVENLLMCSRIAAMVQQPILLSVSLNLAKDSLETLSDIGVNGLIFDWLGAASNKKIGVIIEAIEGLPRSKKKKKKRINATLPNISGASYDEDGDSEE